MNPFSSRSIEPETFLRRHFYNEKRAILINDLKKIDQCYPTLSKMNLVDLLLHGNENFNDKNNYNLNVYNKIPQALKDFIGQIMEI